MRVGVVAIGRNEGERLVRCLTSLQGRAEAIVYVDSGSTDKSIAHAKSLGAIVVELDTSIPFTAARARNAGFARLAELHPNVTYVQFVDGDCELQQGWLETAAAYLDENADVAVVAGRRRERFPDATVLNRLADMEWDTPIGEATEVGGDILIRREVFEAIDGYDAGMIAGEDPELCLRVRHARHRVMRIDAEMTLHDADMHALQQWWKRVVRAGHAYAEGAHMHPGYRLRELRSIVWWGGAVPTVAVGAAPITLGASLAMGAAGYGLLWSRIYRYRRDRDDPTKHAALYATATTVGKIAEMRGVLQYAWNTFVRRQKSELIEYKGVSGGPSR
ncbi:MAG: glycosyltransferase [Myxococcota bacterium]